MAHVLDGRYHKPVSLTVFGVGANTGLFFLSFIFDELGDSLNFDQTELFIRLINIY